MADKDFAAPFLIKPGSRVDLDRDFDPRHKDKFSSKEEAEGMLAEGIRQLAAYQDKLYAQDTYALLIVLQALDAAGKDGVIKHVMTGLNPQGTEVFSFKVPSSEELNHDYLWRNFKALPQRGRIGIFNRSYYEEVLIARVHPEILARQRLPERSKRQGVWKRRYREINDFERYLVENGIVVVKFFLNISKDEQRARFLDRIDMPEKNWKMSVADVNERSHWDGYRKAYNEMLSATSTSWAPWHVIPADRKWFARLAVAGVIQQTMKDLKLAYPKVDDEQRKGLAEAKRLLESEK
jgi:PPK2 family polyphosphate:nucleotide phosphotransferase